MAVLSKIWSAAAAAEARANDALPDGAKIGAGVLYLHTDRGLDRMDQCAQSPVWRWWHNLGIVTFLALMALGVALFAQAAVEAIATDAKPTAMHEPANMLVIPGLNDFMPTAAAGYIVIALLVTMVVHEGGHGLAAFSDGIDVEEWGVALLLGIIPIAAYVKPDEAALESAEPVPAMRVYAAGVLNNLALTAVTFGALLHPATGSPLGAYMTYFGWVLTGGAPPGAAAVASLGPVTNTLFWLCFLNANIAIVNALPMGFLDGGHIVKRLGEIGTRHTEAMDIPRWASRVAFALTSAATLGVVLTALFGAHLGGGA